MDGFSDIVIPVHKGPELQCEQTLIATLFGVKIDFTPTHPSTAQRTGSQWIKVIGPKQARQNAAAYIKGIANPEYESVFTIPDDLIASVPWNHIIFFVQKNFLTVVRVLNPTHLLLKGSRIAVGEVVSFLDDYINRTRQSLTQNAAMAYTPQNQIYHGQQSMQYYQQYHQTGMHYKSPDRCNSYRNQDRIESLHRGQVQNLGHSEQIIAKGMSLPRHQEKQPETLAQNCQKTQKLIDHLRDFAQKLGYTHEEISTAISKFDAAVPSQQALDENSLLQYLTQLYPRKQQLQRNSGESKVVKDSSSTSSPAQVQVNVKDASTEEKFPSDVSHNQELRHIVVDGSNVAMSHGNRDVFSCKGIKICVDYFKQRGHDEITVFVPQWRKEASKPDRQIEDQQILFELENEQILSFTPSRRVNGQRVVCYDDRYIVKLAAENDGIIVSNDNFRDLVKENPEWKKVIEERLLMYTFVKDVFMPPDDPLGRRGPTLEAFLRKGTQANPRLCPYMKKCTYGSKCKFYHPERVPQQNQSGQSAISKTATTDPVVIDIQKTQPPSNTQVQKESHQGFSVTNKPSKEAINTRPAGDTTQKAPPSEPSLQAKLEDVLPGMKEKIKQIIESNPHEENPDELVNMMFS